MIVFFDGVCGICNGFIDFLLKRDHKGLMQFAPIQGDTALLKLDPVLTQDLSSIVLLDGDKVYTKSDAVLRAVSRIGGLWSLIGVLLIIPKFIRDPVYGLIAKNRYKWFGQRDICRVPTDDEIGKILP